MNTEVSEKIAVAVADDHSLFRKGLVSLLEELYFIGEIYEASNGQELLDLLERADPKPGLVLLDVRMPIMDGVEATEKIRAKYPDMKIIILTMQDDENFIVFMIEKGINGYLLKNVEPEELEKALEMLRTRDIYFNERLTDLVVRALHSKGRRPPGIYYDSLFTERELEVIRLICEENTNAEIADILNVSKRTVEGHRNIIFEKAGVKNTAGLVLYAVRNGIVKA
ncbi:MAG TPA: DNA-binding response regulator [Prolixibacteraceae bacterium]|nr:DNA-binding response regulator [Prolixibacteraceae bacterium]